MLESDRMSGLEGGIEIVGGGAEGGTQVVSGSGVRDPTPRLTIGSLGKRTKRQAAKLIPNNSGSYLV